jgi:hypothetical protein
MINSSEIAKQIFNEKVAEKANQTNIRPEGMFKLFGDRKTNNVVSANGFYNY